MLTLYRSGYWGFYSLIFGSTGTATVILELSFPGEDRLFTRIAVIMAATKVINCTRKKLQLIKGESLLRASKI